MSIAATDVPPAEATPRPASSGVSASKLLAYCVVLVSLPTIFLLSTIPIVRSASFPQVAGDPFLLHPEYAASLNHENCEILVFGDSSAVTSIDPTLVEQGTDLKTCNISQSQSILALAGTKALDDYLKQNNPPKFIVIQLTPETFARTRQDFFWPEGLTILLRQEFGVHALYTLATNPAQAYGFALWAIKQRINAIFWPPDFRATEAIFREKRGLLVLPKPPETACYKNWPYYPPDSAWIQSLRAKYSKNGSTVLINVSALPACASDIGRISSSLRGLIDNRVPIYPIGLFCDMDRHLTPEGAARSSAELAQQILFEEAGSK